MQSATADQLDMRDSDTCGASELSQQQAAGQDRRGGPRGGHAKTGPLANWQVQRWVASWMASPALIAPICWSKRCQCGLPITWERWG